MLKLTLESNVGGLIEHVSGLIRVAINNSNQLDCQLTKLLEQEFEPLESNETLNHRRNAFVKD